MFPKGLGNLSAMVKQAMDMKGKMEELKERLAHESIEVTVGGGVVYVKMSGRFEVLSVKIDREIIDAEKSEELETMVMAAMNEGVRRIQEMIKGHMQQLAGGIEIPGLL